LANLIAKIGFGTVGLTRQPTETTAIRLLEVAYDQGITHFDTAPAYGSGYSERLVGKFLRKRSGITIATKFGLGPSSRGLLSPSLAVPLNFYRKKLLGSFYRPSLTDSKAPSCRQITRKHIETAVDSSRKALGVDYIDYYLLHEGLPSFLNDSALDYLLELKRRGIVGKLGLAANGSNYQTAQDFLNWDILQYEYGPAWPGNAPLPGKFPTMRHFFHSTLRNYRAFSRPGVSVEDLPGHILRTCIEENPNGYVLFFSGHPEHIRNNSRVVSS
jgi:aryl-alcohol dehydrogenase-like predicted oxidoreductase